MYHARPCNTPLVALAAFGLGILTGWSLFTGWWLWLGVRMRTVE